MNLSAAAVAIALSAAAGTATVSAYSFSAKASKASSKAAKAKSTKTKASKEGSYSMSMSLPNCKRKHRDYDTGEGVLFIDVNQLVTPEAGETFTYFEYATIPDDALWKCNGNDGEPGIMLFYADNQVVLDGTRAECSYQACYEKDCAPDCCCGNIVSLLVDD